MPCYDSRSDDYERELKRDLDKVTRLLCYACKIIERSYTPKDFEENDGELTAWWAEHQKADKLRLNLEKKVAEANEAKKRALNKLTLEEQRALGLAQPKKEF